MLVQIAFLSERPIAALTDEVLDAVGAVDESVRPEVGLVGERSATPGERAVVRLLAGVRSQVTLEQPRPREVLAADRALVLEGGSRGRLIDVRSQQVRAERPERPEHLLAQAAAILQVAARVERQFVRVRRRAVM